MTITSFVSSGINILEKHPRPHLFRAELSRLPLTPRDLYNGRGNLTRGGIRLFHPQSENLYKKALDVIVGGVNSPSRSFRAVGMDHPLFMKKAKGPYFWDEDGHRYIDYLAAFGPIILGHAHPPGDGSHPKDCGRQGFSTAPLRRKKFGWPECCESDPVL